MLRIYPSSSLTAWQPVLREIFKTAWQCPSIIYHACHSPSISIMPGRLPTKDDFSPRITLSITPCMFHIAILPHKQSHPTDVSLSSLIPPADEYPDPASRPGRHKRLVHNPRPAISAPRNSLRFDSSTGAAAVRPRRLPLGR